MEIQRNNSKLSIMLNTEQNNDLNQIAEHLGISKSILVRLLLSKSISELKKIGLDNLEFKLEQISSKNK
jgi:predicted DNA-binding protein